jgi:hypothetical protein
MFVRLSAYPLLAKYTLGSGIIVSVIVSEGAVQGRRLVRQLYPTQAPTRLVGIATKLPRHLLGEGSNNPLA